MLIHIGKHFINTTAVGYATLDEKWQDVDGNTVPMLTIVVTSVHDTIYLYGTEAVAMHRFLDSEAIDVPIGGEA